MNYDDVQWWYDEGKMLFPNPIGFDDHSRLPAIKGYHLLQDIKWPEKTFFHLHNQVFTPYDLPPGYDLYVVSWQMEFIDFEWLEQQRSDVPIIVLTDLKTYDPMVWPENVIPIRWLYWHYALDIMMGWFGTSFQKNIKYKFSSFCNRISQSKLLITTALLENVSRQDILIKIGTFLEEKNVHHWQSNGNAKLDALQKIFQEKYLGQEIPMDPDDCDSFNQSKNHQNFTADPNQIAYQQTAINFTNENWHYSLTTKKSRKVLLPGPHISEKTFKCLLGGTAFIPVGQFDVYRTLKDLGFQFDYGFDQSFDTIPGDIDRLVAIVDFINSLDRFSAQELYDMTRQSSEHNQAWITSGEFYQVCEQQNLQQIDKILAVIKNV